MNSLSHPSILYPAWVNYLEKNRVGGREIDSEFVRRGFVGVQAEIEFINAVYGDSTYETDIDVHSSADAFQRYRVIESEALKLMRAGLTGAPEERANLWDEFLRDPRLPSFLKRTILRSLSNTKFEALVSRYIPFLRDALAKERGELCTIYPGSPIALHDAEMIPLRKDAINAVMSEAYGVLGFKLFKRKKGVGTYFKALTSDYGVFVEPDTAAIERKSIDVAATTQNVYWPSIPSEIWCYLAPLKNQTKSNSIALVAGARCVASGRREGYDDTKSLEVMVRANALWYEINIQPFEKSVSALN